MIPHDTKEWIFHIFNLRRSDTLRTLFPAIVGICLYSTLIVYLIVDFFDLPSSSPLKNVSLVHTLLGFVISMLLVFRTNTAYDRWWEGRKLWGALVNNSRNLALKMSQLLGPEEPQSRAFFAAMIPNFAFSMKNHLRGHFEEKEFQETELFTLDRLQTDMHVPSQIASAIVGRATELQRKGVLLPEHLLFINVELQGFMDICGACERIHNTPIPFSYSSFIKKFISIYCITVPLGYAYTMEYFAVGLCAFIFYVLASLEVIAEEIEDPFGTDANDLPADNICNNIQRTVNLLLTSQPPVGKTLL